MTKLDADADALTEAARRRMADVRRALLRLHKVLLDAERAAYEHVHGQVSSGEMLQLVINHEQFAWLHALSELIVRIDEMLAADEPAAEADGAALLEAARSLLKPSEAGGGFGRKYFDAMQRDPDVVLAHREATSLLSAGA